LTFEFNSLLHASIIAWPTVLARMKPTSYSTMPHGRWLRMSLSTPAAYLLPPTTQRWIYYPFTCMCWSYCFFTLTCKYNSFLHVGVEAGDEAHPDPWVYLTKEQHLQGGSIGWLRIQRPGTGSVATGRPTSSETCRSGTDWTGRASPWCTTMAWMNMSARCRGW
jgi:hypothetical protein